MNLCIDVGNSHIKAAWFDADQLVAFFEFNTQKELTRWLQQIDSQLDYAIVCSVTQSAAVIRDILSNYFRTAFALTYLLPLPISNRYETAHTLGMDRLAGAAGAYHLFPGRNCLVIDAGTCIKYEFIDKNANYWGGSISPGLRMRFRALHEFTASLPQLEPLSNPDLLGRNTQQALQSGVINGMLAEIEGIISRYSEKLIDLQIILTGGDAPFFEGKMKSTIFAAPRLVLIGLNSILQHNVYSH
jgi:type III pantothenate kinase